VGIVQLNSFTTFTTVFHRILDFKNGAGFSSWPLCFFYWPLAKRPVAFSVFPLSGAHFAPSYATRDDPESISSQHRCDPRSQPFGCIRYAPERSLTTRNRYFEKCSCTTFAFARPTTATNSSIVNCRILLIDLNCFSNWSAVRFPIPSICSSSLVKVPLLLFWR
jgi:hypothetical protein